MGDSFLPESGSREPIGVLIVGAFVTLFAAAALHFAYTTDVDDSWIHLRVALNAARDLGPVFNPGERVEASTSPLWTALLALAIRLGVDGPRAALGFSLASAAAVGAGTSLLAFRLAPRRNALSGLLAPCLTAANLTFTYWASTRMEVAFACALLTWAINLSLATRSWKGGVATGVVLGLAGLARPELVSVVPFVLALSIAEVPREARVRVLGVGLGTALAILLAHLVFRYEYYGALVPNTYVAKVAGRGLIARLRSGAGVARDFVSYQPLLLVPLGWAVFRGRGVIRSFGWLCAALLCAVVWTGGDHFQYSRLAVPLVPLLAVLSGVFLVELSPKVRTLAVVLIVLQAPVAWKRHWWRAVHSGNYVVQTEAVARALRALPPGPVATLGIGVLGYRCPERAVIDLVGLADAHIARTAHIVGAASGHDHSDPDYVVDRDPALVFPFILTTDHPVSDREELETLEGARFWYQSGLDLLRNERFRARYAPRNISLDSGRFIRVWIRKG